MEGVILFWRERTRDIFLAPYLLRAFELLRESAQHRQIHMHHLVLTWPAGRLSSACISAAVQLH